MKVFFHDIDQRSKQEYNLFDILFEILKDRRYLANLNQGSKYNLSEYYKIDYKWIRADNKKEIKNGALNYKNGDEYQMIDYEDNHRKRFDLVFESNGETIYRIIPNILPIFLKVLYVREFSKFFDESDVSWSNVDMNLYIPNSVEKNKRWFKFDKDKYSVTKNIIINPSPKDEGILYYGEYINSIFNEIFKIKIIISPRNKEIINNDDKKYTIENVFNKNMIDGEIDLNRHNKLTWVSYTQPTGMSSNMGMIDYFEKEIIFPLSIEYFDNYLSLFRTFISYRDESYDDEFNLNVRKNIHFVRKEWIKEMEKIKEKMKKIGFGKSVDLIKEVYDLLDYWVNNDWIMKDFSDFLKNEFFSFKKPTVLSRCDLEKEMVEGTYILKYTNNVKLNERNNYDSGVINTVHIPSYKDMLIKDYQYPSLYNDVYLTVFIIYYIKQKPKQISKDEKKYTEDLNYTKVSNGIYENIDYYAVKPEDTVYTYKKTPNIKTNFNDRFFGYYIKSV
jgi:hypothetical protein